MQGVPQGPELLDFVLYADLTGATTEDATLARQPEPESALPAFGRCMLCAATENSRPGGRHKPGSLAPTLAALTTTTNLARRI